LLYSEKKFLESHESTLFMKLDLPTLGKPQMTNVRVLGSIDGRRARCCRTCSK